MGKEKASQREWVERKRKNLERKRVEGERVQIEKVVGQGEGRKKEDEE